jgi:hypothetical protein
MRLVFEPIFHRQFCECCFFSITCIKKIIKGEQAQVPEGKGPVDIEIASSKIFLFRCKECAEFFQNKNKIRKLELTG